MRNTHASKEERQCFRLTSYEYWAELNSANRESEGPSREKKSQATFSVSDASIKWYINRALSLPNAKMIFHDNTNIKTLLIQCKGYHMVFGKSMHLLCVYVLRSGGFLLCTLCGYIVFWWPMLQKRFDLLWKFNTRCVCARAPNYYCMDQYDSHIYAIMARAYEIQCRSEVTRKISISWCVLLFRTHFFFFCVWELRSVC